MLEILDLGNNMISDTFPFWLEKLLSLKVLILRNNMFYGQVEIPRTKFVLPSLRIIDCSSNNFTGKLSRYFLQSLSAMAMGLCGIPLSRKCNEDDVAPVAQDDESLESEEAMFDWRFAVAGFGTPFKIVLLCPSNFSHFPTLYSIVNPLSLCTPTT
nr:receptor-like protein 12 [Ipomoea batatas]